MNFWGEVFIAGRQGKCFFLGLNLSQYDLQKF